MPQESKSAVPSHNQTPPLQDYNLFTSDRALGEAVRALGADWAEGRLSSFGARLGDRQTLEQGALANRHTPIFHSHNARGERIDQVEYHPAWHQLIALGREAGIHALPWVEPRPGAQVARAGLAYLMNQVESGVCCPFSMTYSAIPVLRQDPELAAVWEPKLLDPGYDPRPLPAFRQASPHHRHGHDREARGLRPQGQ